MEARGSHHLSPGGWRPRKGSSVIQRESEGLRTRGFDGVHPSPRAGEDKRRWPSSSREAGKKGPFLLLLCFCSIQDINGLDDVHLHWGGHSTEFADSNAKPTQKHLHRHTQKKHLIWALCGLSGWGGEGLSHPGTGSPRAGCPGRHPGQAEGGAFTEAEVQVRCPDSKGSGPPGEEETAVVKAAEHPGRARLCPVSWILPRGA